MEDDPMEDLSAPFGDQGRRIQMVVGMMNSQISDSLLLVDLPLPFLWLWHLSNT
jgi:hypothetical protein